MSFVQGTRIRITVTVEDVDQDVNVDPPAPVLLITDPAGVTTQLATSRLGLGVRRAILDTSPAFGVWFWQFQTGGSGNVVKRGKVNVRKASALTP